MAQRGNSSSRSAAAAQSKDKDSSGVVQKTASQTITMFFSSKQQSNSRPLEPSKQRAIPQIKQAGPRPVLQSSSDDGDKAFAGDLDKNGKAQSTADMATAEDRGSSSAERLAAVKAHRDDAVDLSLQNHSKEVADDLVTNPVVQVNKRVIRNGKEITFLAGDSNQQNGHGAAHSIQDEQIMLAQQEKMDVDQFAGGTDLQNGEDEDVEIEQASDDEMEGAVSARTRNRGRRRIADSDYQEGKGEDIEDQDSDQDAPMDDLEPETLEIEDESSAKKKTASKSKQNFSRRHRTEVDEANLSGDEQDATVFIDNLPNDEQGIKSMLFQVQKTIQEMEIQFLLEEHDNPDEDEKLLQKTKAQQNKLVVANKDDEQEQAPQYINEKQFWCIPLSVNVTSFDFEKLHEAQQKHGGKLFDIITMDPPWQLSSANPTRGVAIAYDTLTDQKIMDLPFDKLQESGFLFIWVINNKYRFALRLFKKHGYKLVDQLVWVKQTINGKINKGHGYYLQHAKETCLIGYKGDLGPKLQQNVPCDVIFSMRRGQSQKPEEIYEVAEQLVPNGHFLEIFARRNNLHDGWVSIGNEL